MKYFNYLVALQMGRPRPWHLKKYRHRNHQAPQAERVIRLRPHHFLCTLTFVGKGYNPKFTANMAAIIKKINAGEEIEIVDGPDDICAPLINRFWTGKLAHCHRKRVVTRDKAAALDISRLLSISVQSGDRIKLPGTEIKTLRQGFAADSIRAACKSCPWNSLCSSVAAAGYVQHQVN